MKRIFGLVAALCLLGATGALAGGTVTVMSRNVYVGTDVDAVREASRSEVPGAVYTAFQLFNATEYKTRMAAIAGEINDQRPDLVGLQEVTTIWRQSPGDSLNPPPMQTPATDLVADFLVGKGTPDAPEEGSLLYELNTTHGLDYRVVGRVVNADIELPMMVPGATTYDDLRLQDSDVILARDGVKILKTDAANFNPSLHLQAFSVKRGWVYVEAKINGTTVGFASTHIEDIDTVRYAQTVELIRNLAVKTLPLILVGDFNLKSSDDLAYRALVAAGYTDHWPDSDAAGLTCCFFPDLQPPQPPPEETCASISLDPPFTERDDIIFTRNTEATGYSVRIGITNFQDSQPCWASDHAGVYAVLGF